MLPVPGCLLMSFVIPWAVRPLTTFLLMIFICWVNLMLQIFFVCLPTDCLKISTWSYPAEMLFCPERRFSVLAKSYIRSIPGICVWIAGSFLSIPIAAVPAWTKISWTRFSIPVRGGSLQSIWISVPFLKADIFLTILLISMICFPLPWSHLFLMRSRNFSLLWDLLMNLPLRWLFLLQGIRKPDRFFPLWPDRMLLSLLCPMESASVFTIWWRNVHRQISGIVTDNGMNPGDSSCRHLLPITRLLTMMQHLLLSKRMQESSWLLFRRKRFSHFLMSVQQRSWRTGLWPFSY